MSYKQHYKSNLSFVLLREFGTGRVSVQKAQSVKSLLCDSLALILFIPLLMELSASA